jgi:hypothetical protein
MDDQLWYLTQQTRRFREFRAEIESTWTDEAARQVRTRYLNPLDDSMSGLIDSLNAVQTALSRTKESLNAASAAETASAEAEERVREGLSVAQQQWPVAEDLNEQVLRNMAEVQSELELAVRSIERANGCCS